MLYCLNHQGSRSPLSETPKIWPGTLVQKGFGPISFLLRILKHKFCSSKPLWTGIRLKVDREVFWDRWAEHGCELKLFPTEGLVLGGCWRLTAAWEFRPSTHCCGCFPLPRPPAHAPEPHVTLPLGPCARHWPGWHSQKLLDQPSSILAPALICYHLWVSSNEQAEVSLESPSMPGAASAELVFPSLALQCRPPGALAGPQPLGARLHVADEGWWKGFLCGSWQGSVKILLVSAGSSSPPAGCPCSQGAGSCPQGATAAAYPLDQSCSQTPPEMRHTSSHGQRLAGWTRAHGPAYPKRAAQGVWSQAAHWALQETHPSCQRCAHPFTFNLSSLCKLWKWVSFWAVVCLLIHCPFLFFTWCI